MKSVVILGAKRTPIGSFLGSLSEISAPKLGAVAIKAALEQSGLKPNQVQEVLMGNVLQAGVGQAPARQAAIFAGLPENTPCTTINKVCSSGMKAVMFGAQSILTGDNEVVITGGMENMSQVPFYLTSGRKGQKLGNQTLIDGLVFDGLIDVYNQKHMGACAETCAKEYNISREEQDAYAKLSYERSAAAWHSGKFNEEVTPVEIPQRKGGPIIFDKDEEFSKVDFSKIPTLPAVFQKEGTITAANASTINDGASALVLASEEFAQAHGLKPLAKIVSYADAEQSPEWFTTAPAQAMKKALEKAHLSIDAIDFFEINEAFSVVSLANQKLLNIPLEKLNIHGGAVSLGHPLGSSGSRILVTLVYILKQNSARYGVAGICNGGGGASAVVIENINA